MKQAKSAFLITIDTEGDDLWSQPQRVTTENVRFLPRFQSLCEEHGFKPTWLVDYEMAESPHFQAFARRVSRAGTGEIGMHLHAWNSPPSSTLDVPRNAPLLVDYPPQIVESKVQFLTRLLNDRFEQQMVSHRAGRWGFNEFYAQVLVRNGYLVDCSLLPHIRITSPQGQMVPDWGSPSTVHSCQPYYVDLECITREGNSKLLEVPVSVLRSRFAQLNRLATPFPHIVRRAVAHFCPPLVRLRLNGENLAAMLNLLDIAENEAWPCVEFALHSCELMPGGGPWRSTCADIERLYDRLKILFSKAAQACEGMTLKEFYVRWQQRSGAPT